VLTQVATWTRYVPDVGDNRARHAGGSPALIVEIRPPTARTWRRFLLALTPANGQPADLSAGAMHRAMLEDATAEILWGDCVGAVTCPPGLLGGLEALPQDGAALWALRDRLAGLTGYALYQDVLNACFAEAILKEGLADFLSSGSGPPPSSDAGPPGTVPNAASAA